MRRRVAPLPNGRRAKPRHDACQIRGALACPVGEERTTGITIIAISTCYLVQNCRIQYVRCATNHFLFFGLGIQLVHSSQCGSGLRLRIDEDGNG